MGDPSGVGPEVIMKAMASPDIIGLAIFVILGDVCVLKKAGDGIHGLKDIEVYESEDLPEEMTFSEDRINIVEVSAPLKDHRFSEPTLEGSRKALDCLDAAISMAKQCASRGIKSAIVTAPLSKELIAEVSPGFIGHTEYLQEAYSVSLVTMVLTGDTMCVVPVTRHIPIKDVPKKLTADLIEKTLLQVINDRFLISGKKEPVIAVCGLNPHSGEGGKIGREEAEIIVPAINKAKEKYDRIEGPMPADTVFYKAAKGMVDIIVGMYHDQCLAPFKMVDFNSGVNITLGLGHTRTSPDHGTAFDIAGKGIADPGSMERAIKLAIRAIT